jgi:putative transposase
VWPARAGERGAKKGLAPLSLAGQHAMRAELRAAFPHLAVRRRGAPRGTGRTWYPTGPTAAELAARDTAPRAARARVVLDCPGYGSRRLAKTRQREGGDVNHNRVLRVMREESLLCQLKRRFGVTTDSAHGCHADPNLLAGLPIARLGQVRVADITAIRLPATFVYLACILDAHSRRCIGRHLARQIATRLTLAALDHALAARRPAPGLIHHAERGGQYASAD